VHKTVQKTQRPQIKATTKDYNAVIDVNNENIPIQKIIHNPQTIKRTRPQILATTKDYNDDVFEMENENIPIQKYYIIHKAKQYEEPNKNHTLILMKLLNQKQKHKKRKKLRNVKK
jgi:hypothetical protein